MVFILLFTFFQFYSMVSQDSKVDNFVCFFFLLIISSGRLAEIKWSVRMSKSQRTLCVILQDWCWVMNIPFVRMANLNFLHNSQWITQPTNSYLVLYPSVLICCICLLCDRSFLLLFIACFHTNVCWWSFTRVWVSASLLKSPGLFSVFWLILKMLLSGWFPLFLWF